MKKEVAVILSGCGVFDGSEINESVLTHLAIAEAGYQISFYAPSGNQTSVVNHLSQENNEGESRSILEESARISRGEVKPISEIDLDVTGAIILPGGFGAAKNLSNFAEAGPDAWINKEVETLLKDAHSHGLPIGCICIAPAVVALALGDKNISLTIGTDEGTAEAIEKTGAKHVNCNVDEIYVDEKNKIVSTPAYMLAQDISSAKVGIFKLVNKVLEMTEQP